MGAEQDPSMQSTNPEQGSDPALLDESSLVSRLHKILDDRDASEEQKRALLDDPRIQTLIETGQLTVAGALAREEATGATELPRTKPPKRKPVNRRGGRSYNEGSDSEHDPNWTEPAPELPAGEVERGRQTARALAEEMRAQNAAREYAEDKETVGIPEAMTNLRRKGYRPDPATGGLTVIKLDEPKRVPFKDRRPRRPRH